MPNPNLKTIRTIKKKFSRKQDLPTPEYGILGNGQGLVVVPNETNLSYVQIGTRVEKIHNVRVPNDHGVMVSIGYDPMDPQKRQVLSVSTQQTENAGITATRPGYPPASWYRWMANDGGQDPLYSELRAILPLRVSPAGGLYISIYTGIVKIGSAYLLRAFEVINLSVYVPINAGKTLLALIAINTSNAAVVTVGDEVDIADLADDLSDQPATPADTLHALALVRLYYGQTVIREDRTNTDIYDLRMPYLVNLTKDLVGLGNVTNEAQLKRSDNDYLDYDEETGPSTDDWLLLEKGAAAGENAGKKKKAKVGNLPGGGEGSLNITDAISTINNISNLELEGAAIESSLYFDAKMIINKSTIGLPNVTNDAQFCLDGSDVPGLAELISLAGADKILVFDASENELKFIQAENLPNGGGSSISYARIADVKATNTEGGTFTSGSLLTRTLNTIITDDDSIVSLASDQFTLQAGSYTILVNAPAFRVNRHQAVLYNITDDEIQAEGSLDSSTNSNAAGQVSRSIVYDEFILSEETVYEIRHQCATTYSSQGLGLGNQFGRDSVFTTVDIWKK